MHVVESDRPALYRQIGGVLPVTHVNILVEETKHPFHVDKRLAEFAIDPAKEIQRHVQLQEIGVHGDEIADRQTAFLNMKAGHPHHQHQADGDDRPLPDIDHRQRGARTNSHDLIALHRLVIAVGLDSLGVEIFDGFVIQQ